MNTSDLSTQQSITSEMTPCPPPLQPFHRDWGELLKKLSCDLNSVRQWRRRTGNDDLQAVNSLCGPRGACVHTRSCSQTGESCKNKSKLIVMHFPSAKKFNYDGCDRAIQGSRLHYWLVPLRLKCTAPEKKQRCRCIRPSWSLSTFWFLVTVGMLLKLALNHLSYFSMPYFSAKKKAAFYSLTTRPVTIIAFCVGP